MMIRRSLRDVGQSSRPNGRLVGVGLGFDAKPFERIGLTAVVAEAARRGRLIVEAAAGHRLLVSLKADGVPATPREKLRNIIDRLIAAVGYVDAILIGIDANRLPLT